MNLRHALIAFGIVLSTVSYASAQNLTAGAIAGATFASQLHPGGALDGLTGTSTLFTAQKPGFNAGGFLTAGLTEHISVQPEVLFVRKGVKLNQTDNVTQVSVKVNYIEVPVLLRVGQSVGRTLSDTSSSVPMPLLPDAPATDE